MKSTNHHSPIMRIAKYLSSLVLLSGLFLFAPGVLPASANPTLMASSDLSPLTHISGIAPVNDTIWFTDSTVGLFNLNDFLQTGAGVSIVGHGGMQGICSDGTNVWVIDSSPSRVIEYSLDASVGNMVQLPANATSITCDSSHVWVGTDVGLVGIDAVTGSIIAGPVANLETPLLSGGFVWAISTVENHVSLLDTTTGTLISDIALDHSPTSLAVDGTNTYVGTADGVVRISEGAVSGFISTQFNVQSIATDGNLIYAGNGSSLTEISAASFTVLSTLTLPGMISRLVMNNWAIWALVDSGTGGDHQYSLLQYAETNSYNISFDANYGVGTLPDSQNLRTGSSLTVPDSTLKRTDYTFGGWTDGNAIYPPGSKYTVTYAVTFRAVWTPKVLTLSTIKATSRLYAFLPAPGAYPGQLAVDPSGNLYVTNGRCTVLKISVSKPRATPTLLANTNGTWCQGANGYGLTYATIKGRGVLIFSGGFDHMSIYEVPLDGKTRPSRVGTSSAASNSVYNAKSDTLVAVSFRSSSVEVFSHFSLCSARALCHPKVVQVTGGSEQGGWGVALRGNLIFTDAYSNLFGVVNLSGGAIHGHGPEPDFNTMAQDPRGDIFVLSPNGKLWEIRAGTMIPVPFTFAHPLPTPASSGTFAIAYSRGHLYVLANWGKRITQISF
jgi:sugar lactone lactonase YvrE